MATTYKIHELEIHRYTQSPTIRTPGMTEKLRSQIFSNFARLARIGETYQGSSFYLDAFANIYPTRLEWVDHVVDGDTYPLIKLQEFPDI